LVVFTCLRPEQVDLARTRARGVHDLRAFLEYVARGAPPPGMVVRGADSELERAIAARIQALGYEVDHQVGRSSCRVDLAVRDPDRPGRYLLGIECDGRGYVDASTARDRDKLRQAVLEGLGWRLHRVWSTDWWHDPEREMEKLEESLRQAVQADL
jgi:very-short-patch-repair endonuclease